jgi:hypothetical protein
VDSSDLHLEHILGIPPISTQTTTELVEDLHLAVLLLVFSREAFSRKFPSLPHGDEGGPQPQGDDRAEQKSSGIQTDDNIYLATLRLGIVCEVRRYTRLVIRVSKARVSQNWEDIQEIDAL